MRTDDRDDHARDAGAAWPALLVGPLLALTQLSIAYSLVTPSCARQSCAGLHALSAFGLALTLGLTWLAWRGWKARFDRRETAPSVTASDAGEVDRRAHFVGLVSVLAGAFFAVVAAALWLPIWLLPPCA